MFPATSMPDHDWWSALWPQPDETVHSLMPTSSTEMKLPLIVDLCCGDGVFTIHFLKYAQEVIGIELSKDLLDQAKIRAAGQDGISFYVDDVLNLPKLVSSAVDLIFIANTFHGIPNKEEFVTMVSNSLKAGGEFVVINWYKRDRNDTTVLGQPRGPKTELRLSPDEMKEIVAKSSANLFFDRLVEVSPYHYGIVFKKQD